MKVFLSGRPVSVFGLEIAQKDREVRQIETSISLIQNLAGETIGFRGVARDVNERKQQEEQLVYIAYHDTLTGLKNRKWFYENLKRLMDHAGRYQYQIALLYIDIDKFKKVNDEMGHEAGDLLLREIAARLRSCLRRTDSIARIGGDEFAVVMTSPRENLQPEVVAKKIVESVRRPYTIHDSEVGYVSASIGVGVFPKDAADLESFVKIADSAMYRAKVKRNCYVAN
jgi:diguanylate cyclase (GGDEF)-like protein